MLSAAKHPSKSTLRMLRGAQHDTLGLGFGTCSY